MNIGRRVQSARIEAGFSQGELAARVGAIGEDLLREENLPLMAEAETLRGKLARLEQASQAGLLKLLRRLETEGALAKLQAAPVETRLGFLRALFTRVEVAPRQIAAHFAADLAPVTVTLPPRYQPQIGVGRFTLPDGSVGG